MGLIDALTGPPPGGSGAITLFGVTIELTVRIKFTDKRCADLAIVFASGNRLFVEVEVDEDASGTLRTGCTTCYKLSVQGCTLEESLLKCLLFYLSAWLRHDEFHGFHEG